MSANSTAIHGQSSNVGLLGAAAVLSAVVAVGALGFVIGRGVATTTAERPAAGPVVDNTSMSGPRTAQQKALARHQAAIAAMAAQRAAAKAGVDTRFGAQYARYIAIQRAAAIAADLNTKIADPKETGASIVVSAPIVSAPVGTALAAGYETWLKAQSLAVGSDFPDMAQRHASLTAAAYGGSNFAGQYANWLMEQNAAADSAFPDYFQRVNTGTTYNVGDYSGTNFAGQYDLWVKAQAVAAGSDFPDWFQRVTINTGTYGLDGYGGSDFGGQYEQWLKAQAAAAGSSFPDYFQRHEAPAAGGSGGRNVRIAQ